MKIHPVRSASAILSVLLLLTVTPLMAQTANDGTSTAIPAAGENADRQDAPFDGDGSASTPGDSDSSESDKERLSSMQRFEKSVDRVAKWCVGKLAAVFFYEIGSSSFEHNLEGTSGDLQNFKRLYQRRYVEAAKRKGLDPNSKVDRKKIKLSRDDIKILAEENTLDSFADFVKVVEESGYDAQEADFTLSFPKGSMSKDEATALQLVLNRKFTAGRARAFNLTVRDEASDNRVEAEAIRHGIPAIVLWLVLGATFFTVRMGFINIRGFAHAIKVTAGHYDNPEDAGEVTHFQALTAALSATVGLGNIAGVAIAVMAGGPGATFWMIVAGLLGMSSKFVECTLGQKYRAVRPDGRIMGGAMYYLSNGLKEKGLGGLGWCLGGFFAILCVLASFGGGNAFQVNQSMRAVEQSMPILKEYHWLYGLIMSVAVGVVIIGGIRRIAATAEKIVPLMCGMYVLACLWILLTNVTAIPDAVSLIMREAFTPAAGYGGLLGVLVMGFKRAAFSNEAGVGSAAIAHSAAKTDYPVREGLVALLGPFIDTVIVCTMTAMVIVITGAYDNPEYAQYVAKNNGAGLTSSAMGEQISWFPYVLSFAVILFAYSTMISWSYYGERCWAYLFGDRASMIYRILFLVFVFLGSIMSATAVLDLSDLMILGMAFPNILGVVILSGQVKRDLTDYWKRLKAGEFDQTK